MNDTEILNWVLSRRAHCTGGIILYDDKKGNRAIHMYNTLDGARREIEKIVAKENAPKKRNAWQKINEGIK